MAEVQTAIPVTISIFCQVFLENIMIFLVSFCFFAAIYLDETQSDSL
jgi:hypothetical protein